MTGPVPGFDAPPTLAEARRWRARVTSGELLVRAPDRDGLLRWLDREISARVAEQEGGDPDG